MKLQGFGVFYALVLSGVFPVGADDSGQTGQQLYENNCGSCHQIDGGGVPMMQPELIEIERAADPVGGVVEMILRGSSAIEPGMSDFANEMPAFDYLADNEIALIATYVRTHFGNNGGVVSAGMVKEMRKTYNEE